MFLVALADAYTAGRLVGRIVGAVLLVLLVGFVYWLIRRLRSRPISYGRAVTRWWVLVLGVVIAIILLAAGASKP